MRSILIDLGSDPVVAGTAINAWVEDVRIAACLLVGAASAAEAELAAHAWSPGVLAAARPLGKIIKACNELEGALAGQARPAVNTAHMPSPVTLKSIAAVEAARAAMPDERTQATIARVSKTIVAVSPCVEAVERGASVGSRSLITAIDRRVE
jgi:hypothetical protein